MNRALPASFLEKMELLLKSDFDNFMASYEMKRYYGLRVNELKLNTEQWLAHTPLATRLESIPWTENGFYYEEQDRPGKHAHYHAGMYYIQEPSAMVPGELLDIQPGHRVLDLCAAPGGKSTQMASKLQGKGILVTNDLATERTKALAKNIELAGVRNAIVLNEHPATIAEAFAGWFDRVLVDAPCSGEGMFRKNDSMIEEWESYSVARCSTMQRDILDEVAKMVAPGGKMVYSTCTFSPEENEEQIARFLVRSPEFNVVSVQANWGWVQGRPEWVSSEIAELLSQEQLSSIAGTIRLWPHLVAGEGHFVAVLQKAGGAEEKVTTSCSEVHSDIFWPDDSLKLSGQGEKTKRTSNSRELIKERGNQRKEKQALKTRKQSSTIEEGSIKQYWEQFAEQNISLRPSIDYNVLSYGSRIYLQPSGLPSLAGLKVVRPGWYIGEVKNNKFVPSHPLAMGLKPSESMRVLELGSDSELLQRYLKGETIFVEQMSIRRDESVKWNGFILICVDHCPVGFGKYVDGMIKNELPAGWRLI